MTIPRLEVRRLLDERIQDHRERAAWWKREQSRTPEEQTDPIPLSRRDRELGERDLEFGELLPEKPGSVEQKEYEERTGVGFNLERLTKSVGALMPSR